MDSSGRIAKCGYCGLALEEAGGFTADSDMNSQTAATLDTGVELKPLIHVADDSRLLRRIVSDHLLTRFPQAELIMSEDGKQALENMTRALASGNRRGLMILDLQMPRLNGISVAIALRAVEQALGRVPVPIIFFSGVKINDDLKQAMREGNPATYLHKSQSDDPAEMLSRLEKVMGITIRRAYDT